jgi:hypothetical protein
MVATVIAALFAMHVTGIMTGLRNQHHRLTRSSASQLGKSIVLDLLRQELHAASSIEVREEGVTLIGPLATDAQTWRRTGRHAVVSYRVASAEGPDVSQAVGRTTANGPTALWRSEISADTPPRSDPVLWGVSALTASPPRWVAGRGIDNRAAGRQFQILDLDRRPLATIHL